MRFGLRDRLLFPLLALLLMDLGITYWAAHTAAERADAAVTTQLATLTRTLTDPPTFPLTAPVLQKMHGLTQAEFILLCRGQRPVSTIANLPSDFELKPDTTIHGVTYQLIAIILQPGHPDAGATLAVCYPDALRRQAMTNAIGPPLLLGLAVALASLGFVGVGTRMVRRVRQVQHQAGMLAKGAALPLPVPRQNDELRDLVVAFNETGAKLKEYEDKWKQTERLRVLGQFSGGLAHQLRNAATGARLALQLFLQDHPTLDCEAVEVALRQLARIESTLHQFLTLGRPEQTEAVPLDLLSVLRSAVELHQAQARHLGTQLLLETDVPFPLRGQAIALGYLFGNLIGNALEAAGVGGTVRIQADNAAGRVDVIDTGHGPPVELAARLFEPFVTAKPQGIGLGLAVAKQAAEAHGAELEWFRVGEQTHFRVTFLPGEPPAPSANPPS